MRGYVQYKNLEKNIHKHFSVSAVALLKNEQMRNA